MAGIVIAGFGGQGVLVLGQMIAYAGMLEDKSSLLVPLLRSGTEGGHMQLLRGCERGRHWFPNSDKPDAVIIMNSPSFDRFVPEVIPGGLVIYNSTLIDKKPERDDIRVVAIPLTNCGGVGQC